MKTTTPTQNSVDWESLSGNFSETQINDLKGKFEELISGKIVLKDIAGLSNQDLESVYTLAYELYQGQKYDKAEILFRGLCFLNSLEKKFWWGLTHSLQLQKKYEDAVESYSFLLFLEEKRKAEVYLHISECVLGLGKLEEAKNGLREAQKHLTESTEPAVRQRIVNLSQLLEK